MSRNVASRLPRPHSHFPSDGAERNDIWVTNLRGERVCEIGSVTDRLAVASDRPGIIGPDASLIDQFQGGGCKVLPNSCVELTQFIQRYTVSATNQGIKSDNDIILERNKPCSDRMNPIFADLDQGSIDAVHAGAGDQPHIKAGGLRLKADGIAHRLRPAWVTGCLLVHVSRFILRSGDGRNAEPVTFDYIEMREQRFGFFQKIVPVVGTNRLRFW